MADIEPRDPSSLTSRRDVLIGTVRGVAVLAFGGVTVAGCGEGASPSQKVTAQAYSPTVWTELHPDGHIIVNIAKAEMGQHVGTALARVVVEELEADWNAVEIVHVDSDPKWGYMVTGGSWSVHTSFDQLSRAGAAGRIALIEAGAKMLGATPADSIARASRVIAGDRSISYGEIVAAGGLDRAFSEEDLKALTLKPATERRVLGRSTKALDIPEKSRGQATYGIDAGVDAMVYARPVLPSTRYGSRVNSIDDSAARDIPGYLETVQITDPSDVCQGWLAVVAENYPAAIKAAEVLNVDWTPGPRAAVSEADILAEGERLVADDKSGALWVQEGDIASALNEGAQIIDATYRTHSVLHMQLEPVNALAFQRDGHWHIHGGNQWQSLILPVLAKALAVAEDDITLHQYYLGGGFGRRLFGDYMVPAALVAKAIGKPVKMVFTREDDAWLDCARSPSVQRVRTALDDQGRPIGYDHAAAAGWPTLAMAPGFLAEPVENGGKADSFSIAGADHWYSIPNQRVRAINNSVAQETFLPGWLRAVGPGWTHWAVEQHIDEVANALGKDPVAFRLELLDGAGRNAGVAPVSVGGATRLAAVLKRCADKAGWAERVSLPQGTALGVALSTGQERTMPTWVACIARVSVDRSSGAVTVEKLTAVTDVGTVIHPDGAVAQTESALLWGLSMTLHESTRVENGIFSDRNLNTYKPLRIDQIPDLDIEFAQNDHMPSGLGEPGVSCVGPAIANAIFAAVGARVRDLPITAAAVKAAIPT